MPGRTYRNPLFSGTNEYRYGFNSKELDKSGEFGSLTHYDYGFRIYNPSIGKFLSVDPLTKSYPMLTPYQFASNNPIANIDLDGLESLIYIYNFEKDKIVKTKIVLSKSGPLGDGVLVKSDYKGKNTYFYGEEIADVSLSSFKKAYEGVQLDKKGNHVGYEDSKGNPTIGYGHLIKEGETYEVGKSISEGEAQVLFSKDSESIIKRADKMLSKYSLSDNQKYALYDLAFNTGPEKLSQYDENDKKYSSENFFLKFMGDGKGLQKRRFAQNLLYSESLYIAFDWLKHKSQIKQAEKVIKKAIAQSQENNNCDDECKD